MKRMRAGFVARFLECGHAVAVSAPDVSLFPAEARQRLPPLYATEELDAGEKLARVKFFTPWSSWTWYAVEFDGEDTFFGLVEGLERELGYFSLSELEQMRGPRGLRIERDLYFQPTPLAELDP